MNDTEQAPLPEDVENPDDVGAVCDGACAPEEDDRAQKRGKLRAFFAALGYLGIYLGMQLVVTVPYVLLVTMRAVLEYGSDLDALMQAVIATITDNAVLLTAISGVLTLLVLWLIFFLRKKCILREIRLLPVGKKPVWALVPLGAAANLLVTAVLSMLPAQWIESYNDTSMMLLGDISPVLILFIVLFAPVVEEVIFRGLVYTRLKRALPRLIALLIASFAFGVMHQHPVWIAYAFALGVLLCLVMDWFGSLVAPIALHLSFNASSFLMLLIGETSPLLVLSVSGAAIILLLTFLYRRVALPQKQEK